jgi:hypothetical protein
LVGGFDFSRIITEYYRAFVSGNDEKQSACLRWLRGEYSSKTEARQALGFSVSVTINDDNWYDFIKLWAVLVRKIGYRGLVVFIDECVNLYKISHRVSRENNYEKILSMFNDTLQGRAEGLGIVFGGTPQFLEDPRRGLYSYEALRSRLSENSFSKQLGVTDYNSIVLRLASLTKEELYLLLINLRHVFASGKEENYLVPDEALLAFLNHCANKIGESYFRTPRTTIKSFLDLLSILEQYPNYKWSDLIESVDVQPDIEPSQVETIWETKKVNATSNDEDCFSSFKL